MQMEKDWLQLQGFNNERCKRSSKTSSLRSAKRERDEKKQLCLGLTGQKKLFIKNP